MEHYLPDRNGRKKRTKQMTNFLYSNANYRNNRNNSLFGCAKPNTRTANQQFRFYMASLSEIRKHFYKSREELKSITASLSFDNEQSSEQRENALNYLWRSQIIMAYSAFDLYMHEVLYFGFYKMKNQEISKSAKYLEKIKEEDTKKPWAFKKKLKESFGGITLTTAQTWGEFFSWLTLNCEEMSAQYLNAHGMGYSKDNAGATLENDLKNNSSRRNALVHAYDYYDVLGGGQNPISQEKAEAYINFISGLVDSIDAYINSKWN